MKKTFPYIAPILFVLTFLIDAQLSTLFSNWAPGQVSIVSHLLLVVGMLSSFYVPLYYQLFLFVLLGVVYDVYYLSVLGIATTLFPLVIYLAYYFYNSVRFRWLTNVLLLLVLLFTVEFAGFLLARFFQLTNLSVFIFVFYKLFPTLVWNILFLSMMSPLLQKVFKITQKT